MQDLSVRELQAYGAACLARFCAAKQIRSPYVDQLIDHLLLLLVSADLPEWVTAGRALDISGLGDPLPVDLASSISPADLGTFEELVSYCVEISMSEMWGAQSQQPLRFALHCREILESSHVVPPSVDELFPVRDPGHWWGPPLAESDYQRIREWFGRTLPPAGPPGSR